MLKHNGGLAKELWEANGHTPIAQERSQSWVPVPDREMKSTEQSLLPCLEEGAFLLLGSSALGRNLLNQDGSTIQWCPCYFPAFRSWRTCCCSCCGPTSLLLCPAFTAVKIAKKVLRKGQELLENLHSLKDQVNISPLNSLKFMTIWIWAKIMVWNQYKFLKLGYLFLLNFTCVYGAKWKSRIK